MVNNEQYPYQPSDTLAGGNSTKKPCSVGFVVTICGAVFARSGRASAFLRRSHAAARYMIVWITAHSIKHSLSAPHLAGSAMTLPRRTPRKTKQIEGEKPPRAIQRQTAELWEGRELQDRPFRSLYLSQLQLKDAGWLFCGFQNIKHNNNISYFIHINIRVTIYAIFIFFIHKIRY